MYNVPVKLNNYLSYSSISLKIIFYSFILTKIKLLKINVDENWLVFIFKINYVKKWLIV